MANPVNPVDHDVLFLTAVDRTAKLPLSLREYEVARLSVVEELWPKEIAERLTISIKTVSTHLQRIGIKLDPMGYPNRSRLSMLRKLTIEYWKLVGQAELLGSQNSQKESQ